MTSDKYFITPGLQEDMKKFSIMVEEVLAHKGSINNQAI